MCSFLPPFSTRGQICLSYFCFQTLKHIRQRKFIPTQWISWKDYTNLNTSEMTKVLWLCKIVAKNPAWLHVAHNPSTLYDTSSLNVKLSHFKIQFSLARIQRKILLDQLKSGRHVEGSVSDCAFSLLVTLIWQLRLTLASTRGPTGQNGPHLRPHPQAPPRSVEVISYRHILWR